MKWYISVLYAKWEVVSLLSPSWGKPGPLQFVSIAVAEEMSASK